jgi:hypothetical protein
VKRIAQPGEGMPSLASSASTAAKKRKAEKLAHRHRR